MGVIEVTREMLAAKFEVIFPHLDERQRRLLMGAEARALGHGGIRVVARAAGVREATVSLGVDELEARVEPQGRGDPMSPLRWTTMSTRTLAAELTRQGHKVSADTVGDLLREEGFSLQGNARAIEGRRHPDRDAQFRYISARVAEHLAAGQPVISVDTKKKEKVGDYANTGREYQPKGRPVRVRDHDFPDKEAGKAVPYGVY